jgi:F-type H+-transporting ATPase subunit a
VFHPEDHQVDAAMSLGDKIQAGMDHFLSSIHLFEHVQDSTHFHVLNSKLHLPKILPEIKVGETTLISGQITKFMVLELLGAGLLLLAFVWVAKKVSSGGGPQGRMLNLLESFVVFIRDEVAKPAIGSHDAGRFLPFLLTLFFFILILNLFGMVPFLGSATASIAVTAAFAIITFVVVIGSGMKKMGVINFLKAQVPHMDLPKPLAVVLIPGIWLIEVFGLFIKHFVLAVRLFANMFAGHLVLAAFLGLIGAVWATSLVWGVAPVVTVASIALSILELFVAFLQAYVFTFLAALFIGAAQHAH